MIIKSITVYGFLYKCRPTYIHKNEDKNRYDLRMTS